MDKFKTLVVRITKEQHKRLKLESIKRDMTSSDIIREKLDDILNKEEEKDGQK